MYFENYRYKTIHWLMKHVTPVLYKKMLIEPLRRRSIEIMNKVFNNKLVKGVEIGVFRGDNSKNILDSLNIEKLYLIDTWKGYSGIERKWKCQEENYNFVINRFKEYSNVEIIRNFSEKASKSFLDNSLDFVYIDANHSYKYVFQDISLWTLKVKKNGFIAGHDIFLQDSVCNAVKDYCFDNKIYFYVVNPDWYFIKL